MMIQKYFLYLPLISCVVHNKNISIKSTNIESFQDTKIEHLCNLAEKISIDNINEIISNLKCKRAKFLQDLSNVNGIDQKLLTVIINNVNLWENLLIYIENLYTNYQNKKISELTFISSIFDLVINNIQNMQTDFLNIKTNSGSQDNKLQLGYIQLLKIALLILNYYKEQHLSLNEIIALIKHLGKCYKNNIAQNNRELNENQTLIQTNHLLSLNFSKNV